MHIFLTGEIRIGKSTALQRFLKDTGIAADGFLTEFDTSGDMRKLYLKRFDTESAPTERWLVGKRSSNRMTVYPPAFDTFGTDCVASAGKRKIILMDELGKMEETSLLFMDAVLNKLGGEKPVVGVVKMRESPFLDKVRTHPKVNLIWVTKENRDDIPAKLSECIVKM